MNEAETSPEGIYPFRIIGIFSCDNNILEFLYIPFRTCLNCIFFTLQGRKERLPGAISTKGEKKIQIKVNYL